MRQQAGRRIGNKSWNKRVGHVRTLTPTRLKGDRALHFVEEDEDGENKVQNVEKEVKRRDSRNQARDQNRPNLLENSSSPNDEEECEAEQEDSMFVLNSSWDEEVDARPARNSSRSNNMNDSLEYFQSREKWQKKSQISRRNSFNRYRKSIISSSKTTETKSTSKTIKTKEEKTTTSYSNLGFSQGLSMRRDDDKFLSCVSLKASEFDSTGSPEKNPFESDSFKSPKKCASRNYIPTHFQQVDRISDIFVKQRRRPNRDTSAPPTAAPDSNNNNNTWLKDLSKPVPMYVVIGMFVAYIALIYHFYKRD